MAVLQWTDIMTVDVNLHDRRGGVDRKATVIDAWIVVAGGRSFPCRIVNLTCSGALIDVASSRVLPPFFQLKAPSHGIDVRCEARHSRPGRVGVMFREEKSSARPKRLRQVADAVRKPRSKSVQLGTQ